MASNWRIRNRIQLFLILLGQLDFLLGRTEEDLKTTTTTTKGHGI